MFRSILCLSILLQACSSPAVRCDAHLQAINPPAASAAAKSPSAEEVAP